MWDHLHEIPGARRIRGDDPEFFERLTTNDRMTPIWRALFGHFRDRHCGGEPLPEAEELCRRSFLASVYYATHWLDAKNSVSPKDRETKHAKISRLAGNLLEQLASATELCDREILTKELQRLRTRADRIAQRASEEKRLPGHCDAFLAKQARGIQTCLANACGLRRAGYRRVATVLSVARAEDVSPDLVKQILRPKRGT